MNDRLLDDEQGAPLKEDVRASEDAALLAAFDVLAEGWRDGPPDAAEMIDLALGAALAAGRAASHSRDPTHASCLQVMLSAVAAHLSNVDRADLGHKLWAPRSQAGECLIGVCVAIQRCKWLSELHLSACESEGEDYLWGEDLVEDALKIGGRSGR